MVEKVQNQTRNQKRDLLVAAGLFFVALVPYVRSLAPSIASIFDDTLEIQYVVPRLGILHQTGYPLYTLLGKLFALLVPIGDAAYRLNLFSAVCAAAAVAMLYLVIRRFTSHTTPALMGALLFAYSPTFWDQSNAAEVYALQMLLSGIILYAALSWAAEPSDGKFYLLALAMGLGLTHHRLTLLLYPAIGIYVLWVILSFRGRQATEKSRFPAKLDVTVLARAVLLFLAPLLLYLYLPLRSAVGSADGQYQNTLQGFFDWVMATQYTAFLTQNPLHVQHDAAFLWTLFQDQFTLVGLALAAIGLVSLTRKPREWTLLVVALVAVAAFAFNYRTADVEVHFLTTFLLIAIFAGAGADALLTAIANSNLHIPNYVSRIAFFAASIALLMLPAGSLFTNYPANDFSAKWDVHDYGIDLLSQPLENNATIIGILGEMTLVRYVQRNYGLRPDVQTTAADDEAARLAAIDSALNQNRVVYLTRPLKGVAQKYSLSSLGPLIRVQPQPVTTAPSLSNPLNEDLGAMRIVGFDVDASRLVAIPTRWHAENGRVVRVTVYWGVDDPISIDALVSLKIMNKERRVFGQIDHRPVLDAYPTTAWRPGQFIADTYDVPVFLGAAPGEYAINATLYDASTGAVIGTRDLKTIALGPDFVAPRQEVWNIAHRVDADFGVFSLAGYTLDTDSAIRPGDTLPLTLLWRSSQTKISDGYKMRVWLEDDEGKSVASRDAAMDLPPTFWQTGQYVRDLPSIRVPANVPDGKYSVKLAVLKDDQLLGALPLRPTIAELGALTVKNRPRVMTAPASVPHPLEATFDKKIRLLGYEQSVDASRNARLTLYWKSLALIDASYSVYVHLLDAKDKVVASGDAVPGNGEFPTTGWTENEYITDVHSFTIPDDLPRGAYRVEIGWYDPTTNARLKTGDGQDRVLISPINIP